MQASYERCKHDLLLHLLEEEPSEELVDRLAALPPIEYDRQRASAAKKLGDIRLSTLDDEVAARRTHTAQDSTINEHGLEETTPYGDQVAGHLLADEVRSSINHYCVLPDGADVAITLWIMATWCFSHFSLFPRLGILSPMKRCGKSTLIAVINSLCARTLLTSNASPSAIFRMIDECQPTMLFDEADTFFNENEELRGILNSGHSKAAAHVLRCHGDDHSPKLFSTWAPIGYAMIKSPPDTILDRSVIVRLRRKLPSEKRARLMIGKIFTQSSLLRQKLQRWSGDIMSENGIPEQPNYMPNLSNDRAFENWSVLACLADSIGKSWPQYFQDSVLLLQNSETDEDILQMLLADLKEIFSDSSSIASFLLVEKLNELEHRPWCEYRKGEKPLTEKGLANLMKQLGVKPRKITRERKSLRGYFLADLKPLFECYIPSASSSNEKNGLSVSDSLVSDSNSSADKYPNSLENNIKIDNFSTKEVAFMVQTVPKARTHSTTEGTHRPENGTHSTSEGTHRTSNRTLSHAETQPVRNKSDNLSVPTDALSSPFQDLCVRKTDLCVPPKGLCVHTQIEDKDTIRNNINKLEEHSSITRTLSTENEEEDPEHTVNVLDFPASEGRIDV